MSCQLLKSLSLSETEGVRVKPFHRTGFFTWAMLAIMQRRKVKSAANSDDVGKPCKRAEENQPKWSGALNEIRP